jgi:hypothetical protein
MAEVKPSGTLNMGTLQRELRGLFPLKDHPDFSSAWTRLQAISDEYRLGVETALPSGSVVSRANEAASLKDLIAGQAVSIVYGESGSGKSALVKTVLNESFSEHRQVWLGPEQLEAALSELHRPAFGLSASLLDILCAGRTPNSVLILDAAERFTDACIVKAAMLIAALVGEFDAVGCRVVIVGQPEAYVRGTFGKLTAATASRGFAVPLLELGDVSAVLQNVVNLRWLAFQDEAVAALRNLKALAWVIQGAALFDAGLDAQQLSLPVIADRLWRFWTGDKPSLQRLIMKLAERQAAFEHSFPLSGFDGAEVVELNSLPQACPLKRGTNNRYQFEHDLAADWARFQRLKEIAGDVPIMGGACG